MRNQIVALIFAANRFRIKSNNMRRDIFQAIADPTRRAIITLIAVQAMTPNAHCRQLPHYPAICFQTPSHTHRMPTGETGTERQGNLLFT